MSKMKDLVMLNSERVLNDPKYNNFRTSSIIEVNEALDFKVVEDLQVSEPEDVEDVTILSEEETTLLIKNDYENMPKGVFYDVYKKNQSELSFLEQRFVEFYCETYNGTEAAIQAGYTKQRTSASVQASRLLKKDKINEAVTMRPLYISYSQNIPDKKGIRYLLTQIFEDLSNTPMERMKAIDMLAKLDFHYEKEKVQEDKVYEIILGTTEEVQRILDEEKAQQLLIEPPTEQTI